MRLADWQGAFIQALQADGDDSELLSMVNERERSRLSVYRNNAFQALLNGLQTSFPVCQTVLGEGCFTQLAQQYGITYPLNDANLNHYGAQFPQLLSREIEQHQAFEGLEYLPELAALEWSLKQGYYAQDRSAFLKLSQVYGLEALGRLSEAQQQQAVLLLQPDIELLTCQYPVQRIWLKHQATAEPDEQPPEHSDANLFYLVIFRDHFKATFTLVAAAEAQLLQSIKQGLSLGALTAADVDLSVLPKLIQRGWLAGYRLSVTDHG
ncbi:DNA-binding domain-containing protein [Shewanella abyssi]|uniref:HvfC/BufC N-terminal domain-containing protein n=1 Tax=Shewanella abyssi TaxID=311789 RepID=UPI00200F046D|nr:DNA-binding domain-containing protein [Shewanella abyssi]MCL1050339.1 DNA-binding domain-containing protein [Shewanella abyssi]